MKSIKIRIWPEILDYLPAIIPWQDIDNKPNNVLLDFSNCQNVNASGLTILLINTLKLIDSHGAERKWLINPPINKKVMLEIQHLGYFQHLKGYEFVNDLFAHSTDKINLLPKVVENSSCISFPIYEVNFTGYKDRRLALVPFREWLIKILDEYSSGYELHSTQMTAIINEIIKNTADHTNSNAFFGLDIEYVKSAEIKIKFSIGDLGIGIKQNIQHFISNESAIQGGMMKWGFADAYHAALTHGFSTKPTEGHNKGIGMSLIVDGSRGINLKLSVFDAKSRGLVSEVKEISHSELRRNFYFTGRDVGFYYFGEIIGTKI